MVNDRDNNQTKINGKFIRTILNISHRTEGYLTNQNLRKIEMHLGFKNIWNQVLEYEKDLLRPPFFPSLSAHFSFNHQKLASLTWR